VQKPFDYLPVTPFTVTGVTNKHLDPASERGERRLVRVSTPLPHLLPCLDELLNRPSAREVTGEHAAGRVSVLVEVLYGGDTHHREPLL
jgi:hypothetical protein